MLLFQMLEQSSQGCQKPNKHLRETRSPGSGSQHAGESHNFILYSTCSQVLSGLDSNLISLEFVGQKRLQTCAVIINVVIKGSITVIKFIPGVFLQHSE